MMSNREAYLCAVVEHKKPDFVPDYFQSAVFCGASGETFDNGPAGGGFDGFGVKWAATESAGGAGVPLANPIVLKDITAWEDVVRFPDIDRFDWKGLAEQQLYGVDRGEKVIEYHSLNAQFLRITHLMGFADGLCAFFEEPEACRALASAISDYKIRCIERAAEYFNPEIYVAYDDVASQQNPFLSPSLYRDIILPEHKRVNDAARAYGMYPVLHMCGHCESLVEYFIVQPVRNRAFAVHIPLGSDDVCKIIIAIRSSKNCGSATFFLFGIRFHKSSFLSFSQVIYSVLFSQYD